jgi:hypothetical protein
MVKRRRRTAPHVRPPGTGKFRSVSPPDTIETGGASPRRRVHPAMIAPHVPNGRDPKPDAD